MDIPGTAKPPLSPSRRPKLVATDLDGTLLRRDGTVSERTRQAVRAALAVGVEVVVVTARPPRYLHQLADELMLEGVAVCSNGALLYHLGERRAVELRALAGPVAQRAARALLAVTSGLGFAVETGEYVVHEPVFAQRHRDEVWRFVETIDLDQMWVHGQPIVKLLAWSASASADELLAVARTAVGGLAECTHSGGTGLLEMCAPGVSKVTALVALCAARGIEAADVVAFGDMPNDLAMLTWAGLGYAVANAHPSVLAGASARTASNDEDGVAVALEGLMNL